MFPCTSIGTAKLHSVADRSSGGGKPAKFIYKSSNKDIEYKIHVSNTQFRPFSRAKVTFV